MLKRKLLKSQLPEERLRKIRVLEKIINGDRLSFKDEKIYKEYEAFKKNYIAGGHYFVNGYDIYAFGLYVCIDEFRTYRENSSIRCKNYDEDIVLAVEGKARSGCGVHFDIDINEDEVVEFDNFRYEMRANPDYAKVFEDYQRSNVDLSEEEQP